MVQKLKFNDDKTVMIKKMMMKPEALLCSRRTLINLNLQDRQNLLHHLSEILASSTLKTRPLTDKLHLSIMIDKLQVKDLVHAS